MAEPPARPGPGPKNSNELAFRSSTTEGCPGSTIKFNVDNMPDNGIYLWNFGDGSFSNKPDPEHTFAKSGKFEVMLSVSNSGGGNIRNKPSSDLIVIHEAPEAKFNTLKQEFEGHIPSVHFENRSEGGASYLWDFGDGTTSTVAHPDHVYRKEGAYHVELTVTNENGCIDQSMKDVHIERDYNLDAPDRSARTATVSMNCSCPMPSGPWVCVSIWRSMIPVPAGKCMRPRMPASRGPAGMTTGVNHARPVNMYGWWRSRRPHTWVTSPMTEK